MFCTGISRAKSGFTRAARFSSWSQERNAILRRIYAPFAKLVKDSPEYNALAESGRVWEDYFQPGDSERYGYLKLQDLYMPLLKEIDNKRAALRTSRYLLAHRLIVEYAHQSVVIENNNLLLKHGRLIDLYLKKIVPNLPVLVDILSQTALPDLCSLLPNEDASQIAELRNHIAASRWVTEAALCNFKGAAGLSEAEIQGLSAFLLKDTISEKLYGSGWGGKVALGDYRPAPIQNPSEESTATSRLKMGPTKTPRYDTIPAAHPSDLEE
ncbi:hypothetical protein V8C35DRAFT_327645 [Trichoderma chlorosporum]